MPIPKPHPGEKQDVYVARVMADKTMQEEYPVQSQRLAIAYGTWRHKDRNSIITRDDARPVKMPPPAEPPLPPYHRHGCCMPVSAVED